MTSASGVRPWGVVLDSEEDDGQEARTRAGSPPVMRDLRRRVLFPLLAMALGLVGLELAANLGERVAYGAFYWHDQPVGLYGSGPGQRPQLKPGARLNGLLYSIHVNSKIGYVNNIKSLFSRSFFFSLFLSLFCSSVCCFDFFPCFSFFFNDIRSNTGCIVGNRNTT